MRLNPVTYCVAAIRRMLFEPDQLGGLWLPDLPTCWLVVGLFSCGMFLVSCRIAAKRTKGDLL